MSQRHDWLDRIIRQLAAAIARVLDLSREGAFDEAEAELDRAFRSVALSRRDVHALDDSSLRLLLGAKVRLAADLLDAEAALLRAKGEAALAEKLTARAARLRVS